MCRTNPTLVRAGLAQRQASFTYVIRLKMTETEIDSLTHVPLTNPGRDLLRHKLSKASSGSASHIGLFFNSMCQMVSIVQE
jgi:hypothetical protein